MQILLGPDPAAGGGKAVSAGLEAIWMSTVWRYPFYYPFMWVLPI
jgi:hypothetical protein